MNVNELVINVLHTYYRQNILAFLTRVQEYEKNMVKNDTKNLLLKFGLFYFERKEIMDRKNLNYHVLNFPSFFFARYKSGNFKNKISFILYPIYIPTLAQRTITYF